MAIFSSLISKPCLEFLNTGECRGMSIGKLLIPFFVLFLLGGYCTDLMYLSG